MLSRCCIQEIHDLTKVCRRDRLRRLFIPFISKRTNISVRGWFDDRWDSPISICLWKKLVLFTYFLAGMPLSVTILLRQPRRIGRCKRGGVSLKDEEHQYCRIRRTYLSSLPDGCCVYRIQITNVKEGDFSTLIRSINPLGFLRRELKQQSE